MSVINLLSLLAGSLLAGVAPQASPCAPEFPYKEGWLGADGAYSVPLPDGRAVWLFGDTFVGRSGAARRSEPGTSMIDNTVGISTCGLEGWSIRYAWNGKGSASPRAFFRSGTRDYRFWPLDGFYDRGRLYVFLTMIHNKPEGGTFGFETVGTKMAEVGRLERDPERWSIRLVGVSSRKDLSIGNAVAVREPFAYLFSLWADPSKKRYSTVLHRARLDRLARLAGGLEYLGKDGAWKKGEARDDAQVVMAKGSSELSVKFHPELGLWIALTGPTLMDGKVRVSTASRVEGPWSEPREIYDVPEVRPGAPGYDKDTFCYAGKEHPELNAPAGKLVVTYACNAAWDKAVANMGIYHPVAVAVEHGLAAAKPRPAPGSDEPR